MQLDVSSSSAEYEEEIKGNELQIAYVKEYVVKVEAEVQKICLDILALMDKSLIASTSTGENVHVTVRLQRQVSMIQKKRKIVKIAQVQYVDEIVDVSAGTTSSSRHSNYVENDESKTSTISCSCPDARTTHYKNECRSVSLKRLTFS